VSLFGMSPQSFKTRATIILAKQSIWIAALASA
jgi:hypothetical protein